MQKLNKVYNPSSKLLLFKKETGSLLDLMMKMGQVYGQQMLKFQWLPHYHKTLPGKLATNSIYCLMKIKSLPITDPNIVLTSKSQEMY